MGSKWQRAGGKAGGTHVGRQQEKHSSTLGVPTRELVAQALGCELGSLGWSRARYGASQSGRQQGCGQGRGRYLNDSPVGCALRSAGAATSTYGYGTARLLYTVRLRAAVGVRLREQRQGRGHLTTMGEREERHDAAEMEGGCGMGRFGGQRDRGALAKSDINHGRRVGCGLDLDPDDHRGPKLIRRCA